MDHELQLTVMATIRRPTSDLKIASRPCVKYHANRPDPYRKSSEPVSTFSK